MPASAKRQAFACRTTLIVRIGGAIRADQTGKARTQRVRPAIDLPFWAISPRLSSRNSHSSYSQNHLRPFFPRRRELAPLVFLRRGCAAPFPPALSARFSGDTAGTLSSLG